MKATLLLLAVSLPLVAQTVPSEPADLSKLRESWQRATKEATAPINKKYLDALTAMKLRYTKDGNLEAALKVDSEIKTLSDSSSASAKKAEPPAAAPRAEVPPPSSNKKLTTSDKKAISEVFVGKTWEFTERSRTQWFYFDQKGGGKAIDWQGAVTDNMKWKIEPDGKISIQGVGLEKRVTFTSPTEASLEVDGPSGLKTDGTVIKWTGKPSDKVIPK